MHNDQDTFQTLERLNADLHECNANDRARVLIHATIEAGIDQGGDILTTLVGLGFDKQNVGATLANGCGHDPERFDWHKSADGSYVTNH